MSGEAERPMAVIQPSALDLHNLASRSMPRSPLENSSFFLLLMPERTFGVSYHFVCADGAVTGQVQETIEI